MRWLLHFRVCIIISLAVLLISAAVIFSVIRAVLPYATTYKNEIQQEISQQIGLPVEIVSIDAAIHGFSPRLKLIGVSVFDERDKVPLFNFREAFVELDVIASILRREVIVDDVGLVGADLSIEKLSENEWMIQGIKITSEGSSELPDQFLYMLQNSDYLLHDSNIYYQDHTGEKLNLSLLDVNINVQNNFNNHAVTFSMGLPEAYGRDLTVVANLHGDLDALSGDIFIEAHQLRVKQWNKKFNLSNEYQFDAILDVDLWATLNRSTVSELITKFSAENFSIKNKQTEYKWKTDFISSKIRYFNEKEMTRLFISDFYFGEREQPEWVIPTNVIASYDNQLYSLSADFLRVNDVQKIAEVFLNPDQLKAFSGFNSHHVNADIYNLNLTLPAKLEMQKLLEGADIDASFVNLSVYDSENDIRLSGLDAALKYKNQHANINISAQDVRAELKGLFREPLFFSTLQGDVEVKYQDENWVIDSSQLQIKNSHINTFSRGIVQFFSADNIVVDVQTDFYNAYGKNARHYLPVGIMQPELVDWLDMAVTDGYIPSGSFVLHGRLNDFPYLEHNGVFQVLFPLQDVKMQFLEDWPPLVDTSAMVKFNNQSLYISNAKGKTHGVVLEKGHAEILDLSTPHLTIHSKAESNNETVQSYIWNSALDSILGDSMRLFQFDGTNKLDLTLEVPLDDDEVEVGVEGHIQFSDTEIYYPALGYEIKGINGSVDFTEDSISADTINAKMQNKVVSINAETIKGASGPDVVFHLAGSMQTDYLLQHYNWLPENWLSGESNWLIDIEIPYKPEDYLVHINARSSLEGAVFQVSDQVQKAAGEKLSFSTEIDVLENNGLQVVAKLTTETPPDKSDEVDSIFDLFAVRDESQRWHFNIASVYLTGKGAFTEGLDKDTDIQLDLDNIDVYSLFVTEGDESAAPLNPADFPPLDWKAKTVLWDDMRFTDVKMETNWHKHGMLINHFSLTSAAMTFDARGTWLTSWRGSHETVLQGTINSSNLGDTLVGLNFQRSLDHCNYASTFDVKWSAEPYRISWANMKGKVSFEMFDGEILEVDPGAGGRLLGLLNIFKLTNRLALDFDDVTRKGFAFDSIKGEFEFVDGDGSLTNFDVIAPAADINMFGSIGLIERDYGLLMRVKPHTDTLTFAGGAILGGVVVGAGLALIQKVFDLGVIGHNVYSITGSWDDPKVEKIVERNLEDEAVEEDDF